MNYSENSKIGDTITFGKYPKRKAGESEPIEWLVLAKEDDNALLISKYALDCKQFDVVERNSWEKCNLRTWLNVIFLNNAFNESEQKQILETCLIADKNLTSDAEVEAVTNDKIFVLSILEAKSLFADSEARKCVPTEYAATRRDTDAVSNGECWWWLRSPGDYYTRAAYVSINGEVDKIGLIVSNILTCVRPALWIKLDS